MTATQEKWFVFKAYNTEKRYGFGTDSEASQMCEILNRGMEINLFAAEEIDDADLINALENGRRNDGINLSEAIAEIFREH